MRGGEARGPGRWATHLLKPWAEVEGGRGCRQGGVIGGGRGTCRVEETLVHSNPNGCLFAERLLCLFRGHDYYSGAKMNIHKCPCTWKGDFLESECLILLRSHPPPITPPMQGPSTGRAEPLRTVSTAQRVALESDLAQVLAPPLPSCASPAKDCSVSVLSFKVG